MPFQRPQPLYNSIPLPRQYTHTPLLDCLLQRMQSGAGIVWSVSEHPTTAVTHMLLPYDGVWQDRPATTPCTNSLTVWSEPTMDRPIVIRKEPYVSVGDVLVEVYRAIRRAALDRFQPCYQPLLIHSHTHGQIVAARPHPTEQQIYQWVLHHLGGRFTWRGLSASPHEADVWVLHIR